MKYFVAFLIALWLIPFAIKGSNNAQWVVTEYFHDAPDLILIAKCESEFRQYDKNGEVLRGTVNKSDVGVMQINLYYHGDTAKRLGYDLFTLKGNMEFARYLYERYGDSPWIHSKRCWDK